MLHTPLGIDDVERLLAPLETFFDKRKQNPVFFLGVVKERADMTFCAKHRAREANRLRALILRWGHVFLLRIRAPVALAHSTRISILGSRTTRIPRNGSGASSPGDGF